MYKIYTSLDRLIVAAIFGGLLSIVLLPCFLAGAKGQETLDLKKPFKKCWEYGAKNGLFRVIASDNKLKQLIISDDNSSIISVDPITKLENWKSEISGKLEPTVIFSENYLFFVTSLKQKVTTLNSISLKTGITGWQKRIVDNNINNIVEIEAIDNKELIFLTKNKKVLSAIQKNDGSLRWEREFVSPIISINSSSPLKIKVLTESLLLEISVTTGNVLEEIKVENNSAKKLLLKEKYLLLGYSTGEVTKIIPSKSKNEILWKIKTGGNVSNLMELDNGVLVTSLDNFMYFFTLESGKLKWKRRMSGRINKSPFIFNNYAVVVNTTDSYASVVDLQDGKIVNQIQVEDDNYFSESPIIFKDHLILQTYKGIYFFSNMNNACL